MGEKSLEGAHLTLAATLLAGGLAISGCANSAGKQAESVAGYAPDLSCSAHMYQRGDVSVVIQDLDKSGYKMLHPSEIRILPNDTKPRTKPAKHNAARFKIAASSGEVDVQAKVKGRYISCGEIGKFSVSSQQN